ncbi:MAG: hypothetical protein IJS96_05525 [Schwartzia sp.]|nr:hypothetical protein [Schwartzia sp. (in: firmicutes)]
MAGSDWTKESNRQTGRGQNTGAGGIQLPEWRNEKGGGRGGSGAGIGRNDEQEVY